MSYKKKLSQITTFIFDVDGVLTDGSVILESSGESDKYLRVGIIHNERKV